MLLVVVVIVDVPPQLVVGLVMGLEVESGWRLGFARCLRWLPEGAAD